MLLEESQRRLIKEEQKKLYRELKTRSISFIDTNIIVRKVDIKDLAFRTLIRIEIIYKSDGDRIIFETEDKFYVMSHERDCCEKVYIKSIDGEIPDLIGSQILKAEESKSVKESDDYPDHTTWTFYKLATQKGYVDISWYGESN